jgi:glycosyltransferase involved in cell wall biosynthesis
MVKSPLVSIITPSFNQAAFLEKTIRSVLDQDYPAIEYLVVDGGSNDGSFQIIEKYQSELVWWVSEKDSGQAEAINKGLLRAKGEYVAWLNSDDYLMPGAVSAAVRVLLENPNASFVFGNVRVVDPSGSVINTLGYGDWGLPELMSFHIIGQPAVFMRRSSLEKTGFVDTSFHFLLDHHLWIRLAMIGEMKYIPQVWASAHYHEGCKNLAQAAEFGKEALRIVEWMKSTPALAEEFSKHKKQILAGANRLDGFYLLDAREYGKSFRAYWRSFCLNPSGLNREWYRMIFAFFAPLGLEGLRAWFIKRRIRKSSSEDFKELSQ